MTFKCSYLKIYHVNRDSIFMTLDGIIVLKSLWIAGHIKEDTNKFKSLWMKEDSKKFKSQVIKENN